MAREIAKKREFYEMEDKAEFLRLLSQLETG
jgi:hypothetical protein